MSDTEAAMRRFMDGGGWTFPVMMCPDEIAIAYEVQYIPAVFVLDSQGRIAARPEGLVTAEQLVQLVDGL